MGDPVHQRNMDSLRLDIVMGASKVGDSLEKLAEARQKNTWSFGKSLLIGLVTVATGFVFGAIAIGVHARRSARLENKYQQIAEGAENFYKALTELRAFERKQESYEKTIKVIGETVKLTYSPDRGAVMHFDKAKHKGGVFDPTYWEFNSFHTMQKFEMDVMHYPEAYGKRLVKTILGKYEAIINNPAGRNQAANQRNLVELETRGMQLKKEAGNFFDSSEVQEEGAGSLQLLNQQDGLLAAQVTVLKEAKIRLQELVKELLTTKIGMAPAECDFLEASMSLELTKAVLSGNIRSPEAVRAFVNRNASGRFLTTMESRAIYDQFEKAQAAQNDDAVQGMENLKSDAVKFEEGFNPLKESAALPPQEVRSVHDFVADLISSDYAAEHDSSMSADAHVTGKRLRLVMKRHADTVGRLMENRERRLKEEKVPDLLKHLDPAIKERIEKFLDKLNERFDESQGFDLTVCKFRLNQHASGKLQLPDAEVAQLQEFMKNSRTLQKRVAFLTRELVAIETDEEASQGRLGTDTLEDIADSDLSQVQNLQFSKRESNKALQEMLEKDPNLEKQDSRNKISMSLDLFAYYEKEIDEGVASSIATVQKDLNGMIDEAFGNMAENRSFDAVQMQDPNVSLQDIIGNPGANADVKLMRQVMQKYFDEMSDMDKRSMIAAMTRFSRANASKGARLGALLKGAGPVMQKMLQGMDEKLFANAEFRTALADMRSNLAPISPRAVQAYLFDIVKQSQGTAHAIKEIVVEKALGAASISQALKCTFKMQDGTERHCVVKMVRPEAEMRARRERVVFARAAQTVGGGMDKTFAGRYKSIMAELDLKIEAQNIATGAKVYDWHRQSYDDAHMNAEMREAYGTFANVHSMKLAEGTAPTKSILVLEEVPGMTLEKFNEATAEESTRLKDEALKKMEAADKQQTAQIAAETAQTLGQLYDEARAKYESVQNLTYMWVNEGLFAEGFYHGDIHKGNVMVQADWQQPKAEANADDEENANVKNPYEGITLIDFGNATRLDAAQKKSVLQVVAGCAAGEASLFMKGFEALLSKEGSTTFNTKAIHREIKAKVTAILAKGTIADTAVRLAAILEVMQRDYQIEVPGAIHNFLESQRRLQTAMEESAQLMKQIAADRKAVLQDHMDDIKEMEVAKEACQREQLIKKMEAEGAMNRAENENADLEPEAEELDVADQNSLEVKTEEINGYRFRHMVECISDVVMQNLFATMKAVGIASGSRCFNRIQSEMVALQQAQQLHIDNNGHLEPAMVEV